MSLLTDLIVKSSHILAEIFFTFLNKSLRPNLKSFQYQIWTSVKRSRKQLSGKIRFIAFFFRLIALISDQNCVKASQLQNLSNKSNLKGSGAS